MNACGRVYCTCCQTSYVNGFRDGYVSGYVDRDLGNKPLYPIPKNKDLPPVNLNSSAIMIDHIKKDTYAAPTRKTCDVCLGQGGVAYDRYEPRRLTPCWKCTRSGKMLPNF